MTTLLPSQFCHHIKMPPTYFYQIMAAINDCCHRGQKLHGVDDGLGLWMSEWAEGRQGNLQPVYRFKTVAAVRNAFVDLLHMRRWYLHSANIALPKKG